MATGIPLSREGFSSLSGYRPLPSSTIRNGPPKRHQLWLMRDSDFCVKSPSQGWRNYSHPRSLWNINGNICLSCTTRSWCQRLGAPLIALMMTRSARSPETFSRTIRGWGRAAELIELSGDVERNHHHNEDLLRVGPVPAQPEAMTGCASTAGRFLSLLPRGGAGSRSR